jgi:hypothetical protein
MATQQRSLKISGSLSRTTTKSTSSSLLNILFFILAVVLLLVVVVTVYLFYFVLVQHQGTTIDSKSIPKQQHVSREQKNLRNNNNNLIIDPHQKALVVDSAPSIQKKETLVLTIADVGVLRIVLRPDLSQESVDYIRTTVQTGCKRCTLYRAEKPGILQGIMAAADGHKGASKKGACPAGYQGNEAVKNDCPAWDQNCACHGPVMTRGMVSWAAGGTGPDFFIDAYPRKADWWGTQHTVFGEIQDAASLQVVDEKIFGMPVHDQGGLKMLDVPLHFEMALE